jgi:hypothetical protein
MNISVEDIAKDKNYEKISELMKHLLRIEKNK